MLSPKTKIGLLVATHVVCGLALAWHYSIWPGPNNILASEGLMALAVAEAALLAIWGALCDGRLGWRLTTVLAAMVYLWAAESLYWDLVDPVLDLNWTFDSFDMMPVEIFVILSVLRISRVKLHLVSVETLSPSLKDNQFSIRHLLLTTAAVAGMLGIVRAIRSATEGRPDLWLVETDALFGIVAQFATLWAAIGIGRPALRLSVVISMTFVGGFISRYHHFEQDFDPDDLIFVALTALPATITAASLLVVRSCGWRLAWGRGGKADGTMDAGITGEQHGKS